MNSKECTKPDIITADTTKERNRCLDFFKGIAAICVVFVHVSFTGKFGSCVTAVGSCGVMLFFLISGYYAYGERDQMCSRLMKRFRRNLLITLIAVLVYFAVSYYQHMHVDHDLKFWLRTFNSPRFYLRMIYCSDLEAITGDPLWFMFALLHAYVIFWLMYKLRLQKYAKFVMPLFILLRIILETYKYKVNGDWRICSNVLVAAMPLMLLGFCIAEWKDKLMKVPALIYAVCGILALIILFLLIRNDPFRYNITQIFKLLVVVSAFLFAQKKPSLRLFPPLDLLGSACSLHVYLWHMPVIVMLYPVCWSRSLTTKFYDWYFPLIVAAIAIMISILIAAVKYIAKKLLTVRKKQRQG